MLPLSVSVLSASDTTSTHSPLLDILTLETGFLPSLPTRRDSKNCAYVTLLTRDSYVPGVQCLATSLRLNKSKYPILVMYTPDTLSTSAVALLTHEGCIMMPTQRFHTSFDASQYKLPIYAECWTKLNMFKLVQYSRLCYLDADMLVVNNIDHVMDLAPGFYAVPDCSYGRKTQEEKNSCALFCKHKPHYFNAGFFLCSPSITEFDKFEQLLCQSNGHQLPIGGYAEQDFLNHVYKDTWKALPVGYNLQKGIKYHHPELWKPLGSNTHVIHYTDTKPWLNDHDDEDTVSYKDIESMWHKFYTRRRVLDDASFDTVAIDSEENVSASTTVV